MKSVLFILLFCLAWTARGQSFEEDENAGLNGDMKARGRMAWRYATGKGVIASPAMVLLWAEPAAKEGDVKCMNLCGRVHLRWKEYSKALRWFKEGVRVGDPEAMYYLGVMYNEGWKVKRDVPKAMTMFREAAREGIPGAAYYHGKAYLNGLYEHPRDTNRALYWFRQALNEQPSYTLDSVKRDLVRRDLAWLERKGYAERPDTGSIPANEIPYVTKVYENGDRYNGEMDSVGCRHGWGTYVWAKNGDRYEGQWKLGNRDGGGVYRSRTSVFVGSMTFPHNDGIGYKKLKGLTYYGDFMNNECYGWGMTVVSKGFEINGCKGAICHVGYYTDWKKRGFGRCYDKSGKMIYAGKFKDNVPVGAYPSGEGVVVWRYEKISCGEEGDYYEGETCNGRISGYGVYHYASGDLWIGRWSDGKREDGVLIDTRGRIKEYPAFHIRL